MHLFCRNHASWSCSEVSGLATRVQTLPLQTTSLHPWICQDREGSKNEADQPCKQKPHRHSHLPATYAHHASLCYSCRETRTTTLGALRMFPARPGEQHAPIHARSAAPSPVLRLVDGLVGRLPQLPEQDRHQ